MTALRLDAHASVDGRLEQAELYSWLTTTTFAPSKQAALDFIVKFNRNFKRYNDAVKAKTERITEETKKTLL
ncbi:hypothetical protein SEMRO_2778_G336910.1 [Seminavis robusta]|nr:hypothetical protein SEMRO_2778_G336910.1 [Seminavis robusta]|eukprot:Sro2778_g336910.1 n/a (72) ;mRNA; f:6649-6864